MGLVLSLRGLRGFVRLDRLAASQRGGFLDSIASAQRGLPRAGRRAVLHWLRLAAAGSTLLLATTNQISQEVAVIPFLWIAPLAVYLLTFVLAFDREQWYLRAPFALAAGVFAAIACGVISAGVGIW